MDLPVPVERSVDLLLERGRMQDEVVRRTIERGEVREHAPEGIRAGLDLGVRRPAEVGVVAPGHDPDLERRP
jgi:hypothetical protein